MGQRTMSFFEMMRKVGRRPAWAVLCGSLVVGCATSRSEWAESGTQGEMERAMGGGGRGGAQVAQAQPPFDPATFASKHRTPAQCEAAARKLQKRSRDEGWAALNACVDGMPFTALQALLGPAWAQDLQERPDAAALLARVIAYRGGSVEGDLQLLQEKRIPIFGLEAAMTQPETYKGRYVLFRAQVGDLRNDAENKPTVWLVEHSLASVASEQRVGAAVQQDTATTWSGSVSGQAESLGVGNLGGTVGKAERQVTTTTIPNYDNISQETGREALGRLNQPDPFLAPGRDFVILGRFDGMRVTAGTDEEADEDAPQMPVLSIVSYYSPQPLVVY